MNILICSVQTDGCGFVGHTDEFGKTGGVQYCPKCPDHSATTLTKKNWKLHTLAKDRRLVDTLLWWADENPDVELANCGCMHHAEDRIPCMHDVAATRERFYKNR